MRHTPARLVFSPNATGPLHEPGRRPGPSKAVPSPANWEDPYLCKKSLAVLNQRIPPKQGAQCPARSKSS